MALTWLLDKVIRNKPELVFSPVNGKQSFFCPVIDNKTYESSKERHYLSTLVVFRCNIENNGESKAFITGYNLHINEYNYSNKNLKPKDYRHSRVEFSKGNPPFLGGPTPKFSTTGSIEINALTPLDEVELPFFIEYEESHKGFDFITATISLVHRPGKWNSRSFHYSATLKKK